jgi:phosphoribosylformylglycinamidine synthase
VVASIPVGSLTDDAPVYDRPRQEPEGLAARQKQPELPAQGNCEDVLKALLGSPNIADKRWVYRQYDHMVRLATVIRPGAADAAVLRIPGTEKAVAVSTDCNAVHVKADPYIGSQGVIAEAARNVACTGAEPIAVTDCLNFGNPERPEVMWEFERSVAGLGDALRELDVPVVSGNVSLYNETGKNSIHPTPSIGMVGLIEAPGRSVGMGLPSDGGELVLLGTPRPILGASAYALVIHGVEQGSPPQVHWREERALLSLLREGIAKGLIQAAHDVSDGGLAVALAEMAIAGSAGDGLGCEVNVAAYPDPVARELFLFGETHGCAWVVVETDQLADFLALAQELGCMARHSGRVGGDRLRITDAHQIAVIDLSVAETSTSWKTGFTSSIGLTAVPERV